MLLPIKKFYKLFKDPEKPEDELTFNWYNEKLLEVKTKKKTQLNRRAGVGRGGTGGQGRDPDAPVQPAPSMARAAGSVTDSRGGGPRAASRRGAAACRTPCRFRRRLSNTCRSVA